MYMFIIYIYIYIHVCIYIYIYIYTYHVLLYHRSSSLEGTTDKHVAAAIVASTIFTASMPQSMR